MASDLSFNIVALDKASSTFLKVAEQLDKVSERLDRLDGKDVNVDVNVKTDESTKALDSFTTRFQLMTAGIAAGAPLAGAAIVGGIGAGFIGVAALAQKSNKDVQEAYTGLWRNVVTSTKAATDQLVPQIVGAAGAMDAEFQRLGPSMKAAFSAAGPDIVALTRGVTDFTHNAMPGITSAMQNSLPVFSGVANAAGTLGTSIGNAAASASQHATEYGVVITSVGNITGSVITGVVGIVNDLGAVWATNSAEIDGAVGGTVTVIAGLAAGALPAVSLALGTAAGAVRTITDVLGPLAPILGTVGAVALTTWGAFKLAGLVTTGVQSLAMGVVTLGGNMEAGAAKSAVMIAGMQGVAVESSVAATAVKTAGTGAATAAVGFGAAASSIAGPLGIALVAGTLLLGAFASSEDGAKLSSSDLKSTVDNLTSAFEASHGAITQAVIDNLQHDASFKKVAESTDRVGIAQTDLVNAVTTGGPALDELRGRLEAIVKAHTDTATTEAGVQETMDKTAVAAKEALGSLNGLAKSFTASQTAAERNSQAIHEHANALVASNEGQAAAGRASRTLGLDLGSVTIGFQAAAQSGNSAASTVQDVASTFIKGALGIATAKTAISDHFVAADKAVVSAQQGVSDATSSYEHSLQSVADAQHSYVQAQGAVAQANQGVADAAHSVAAAQRSLGDAYQGVTTAEQSYTRAQQQELSAQNALNAARQQAIEDLKALHLQLEDAVVSEESARVRLFESQQTAAGFGVTGANAKDVAGQTVTAGNIGQVKAAIDLVSAQNALNNALNSGANLRKTVSEADRAGVEGSKTVVSAQDALRSAQDQVKSSAQAVVKAHQAVVDAAYGVEQANRSLARAHQGVTDAAYGEQKAHLAVRDAQEASTRSAGQLQRAKETLSDATAAASRTLDLNTKAGQDNMALLMQLWTAISGTGMKTQDQYNALVDATARSFNMSRDAAIDYLKNVNAIPQDFKYSVTAMAGVDTASLQQVFKSTSAGGYFSDSMNQKKTVGNTGLAQGGHISGPGGPTDDVIPIMASDGEYMQPADVVSHYGVGFMEDIRTKKVPKGYAAGGVISMNALGAGTGAAYIANVNAQTVMGLPHPAQLPKYVPPPVVVGGGSFGGGPNGAIPTGQHLAMIDAALAADGIARGDWPRWEAGMNVLIQRESGWNPNSINLWDSNAAAGHPSGGLTQTIASTFAGNRNPSLPNNMFDGVANIAASINYIQRRYGDISRVQQANPNLPPRGYDQGGWLMPGGGGVNGLSKPEAVLTPTESEAYVSQAKAAAAGAGGTFTGTLVLDSGELLGVVRGQIRKLERASGVF